MRQGRDDAKGARPMEHYKDTHLLMRADHVDAEYTEPEETNEETQLPNDDTVARLSRKRQMRLFTVIE